MRQRPKHGSGESIMTSQTKIAFGQFVFLNNGRSCSAQARCVELKPLNIVHNQPGLHTYRDMQARIHNPKPAILSLQTFDRQMFYRLQRLWSPDVTSEIYGWIWKKQEAIAQTNFRAKSRSMPQNLVGKYGSGLAWQIQRMMIAVECDVGWDRLRWMTALLSRMVGHAGEKPE